MSALAIATVVFICCFGGALAGVVLYGRLHDHHRDAETKEAIRLIMGLVATLAALVLGLVTASAKTSYDVQRAELQQMSANVAQLDQELALYGPETHDVRIMLKLAVTAAAQRIWPERDGEAASLDPALGRKDVGSFFAALQNLSPRTEVQKNMQAAAWALAIGLSQSRMLMYQQQDDAVSWPMMTVLVCWLSMLFLGFGLFAHINKTLIVALVIGALSVSSSIFLIIELNQPYSGLIKLSDAPIRSALASMNR